MYKTVKLIPNLLKISILKIILGISRYTIARWNRLHLNMRWRYIIINNLSNVKGHIIFTTIINVLVLVLYSILYLVIPFTSFWTGMAIAAVIALVVASPVSFLMVGYAEKIRNQRREAIANDETKSKLINVLGHDIKSPLNNIKQTLYMLNSNMLDEEEFDQLVLLLSKNVDSTLNLTNNLIKWIHVQQYDFKPKIVKTRVHVLLQETVEIYHTMASDKKITLTVSCEEDYETESDPEMIKIVIRNLLSNAIKFTHENGKVQLDFRVMGNLLVFQVKDNGIGMNPDRVNSPVKLRHIESEYGTQQEKGTGLGLNLCKNVADKLGGHIWVRSGIGKGTTFYFSVPVPMLTKVVAEQPGDDLSQKSIAY